MLIPVADAIMMMIGFGSLIVAILGLVVVIVKAMTEDNKKDRR
ncbi:putative holin-like toxin [Lacticaseibacillus sp. N501-2]